MSKTKLTVDQKVYLASIDSKKKRKKQKKAFKLGNLIDSQFKVTITEIIPPANLNFELDQSQEIEKSPKETTLHEEQLKEVHIKLLEKQKDFFDDYCKNFDFTPFTFGAIPKQQPNKGSVIWTNYTHKEYPEIEKPIKQKVEVVEDFFEKLKGTGYENSFFKAIIPIGTPMSEVLKAVDDFHNQQESLTKEKLEELTNPDFGKKNNETPMEFCVEITEDNFIVLNKIFLNYTTRWGDILRGRFLHTNRLNSQVYYTSNNLNLNKKEVPVVSTEEFLCYIGKEKLIFPKELDYLISDKKDMENSLQKAIDRENMYLRMLKNKPKPKTYTKEDMENCFNESRLTHPMIGFKHQTFNDYLKDF